MFENILKKYDTNLFICQLPKEVQGQIENNLKAIQQNKGIELDIKNIMSNRLNVLELENDM